LFWSKGAERVYGWSSAEAVGRNIFDLLYKDRTQFDHCNDVVLKKDAWLGEVRQQTKDRGEIIVEGRSTLIRDAKGQPKSVLAINTDITETKKIEAQLLRVQRMESIGTLAGGVAHDLNNALGPIMLSIDLLQSQPDAPPDPELLNVIKSSSQRGADMIRQLLSFARGYDGERTDVQVAHIIKEVAKMADETFLKNIKVRTDVPEDLWAVSGDPTQLHQVLLNLCVNARDAMPGGGVLTISAGNVKDHALFTPGNPEAYSGPYIFVRVEDTGIGMSPGLVERIFDPFFTTKELGKGTGLGLSTTQAIVRSHGGYIRVSSEPKRGSKFDVYLPAKPEVATSAGSAPDLALPKGNGELILVVDDEIFARQIAKKALEAYGYRVMLAASGAEAIKHFADRCNDIALVLTDMMMPAMDGPATIEVLRRFKPDVRIIGASGLALPGSNPQWSHLGLKHFLPKPFTAETLLKTVRQILEETLPPEKLPQACAI
jgi:PAS domain S-box-containing protein